MSCPSSLSIFLSSSTRGRDRQVRLLLPLDTHHEFTSEGVIDVLTTSRIGVRFACFHDGDVSLDHFDIVCVTGAIRVKCIGLGEAALKVTCV